MTMHTAKGLEYDAVFVTGVEEDLIPHRISAGEPGGPQEERRLFYVAFHPRARSCLSLAMTRAQFGEVSAAMPSPVPAGDSARAHRLAAVAGRCELPRGHAVARPQRAARRVGRREGRVRRRLALRRRPCAAAAARKPAGDITKFANRV